jgi:hypothetical protein
MKIEEARGHAARAWCEPATSETEMDVLLGEEFAKILVACTSVPAALGTLTEAMKEDDMANGWHANIAVLLTDEGVSYDKAQERAAGFMRMVFNRDTLNLQR